MRRAGNSDQNVASSVGLWIKAAPLPPTLPVQGYPELRIQALRLHSCGLGAWPKDANRLFGGLNACAQGLSVCQGARDQSLPTHCTSYTGSALLQHALPVPMALKYRQLLGFGERCLQDFTHKMFSLSDSITNRKMAKPDTARTQLPDFQHGGWEKGKKRNKKWTKPGSSVMISNGLFAKSPWAHSLDMLCKPQVNWEWVCGTTWESSRFRTWSKGTGTCIILKAKDKVLGNSLNPSQPLHQLFCHLWEKKKGE